jgi:hypothetical protein
MQEIALRNDRLYQRILGAEWHRLHPTLREAHFDSSARPAYGSFRVVHGKGRLARLLAGLLGLPHAAEAVPIQLEITADDRGQRWFRTFGDKKLTTLQFEAPGHLLAERFSALELRFRLVAGGNSLRYEQERAFLCIGRQRLPLPRRVSPSVSATETVATSPGRTHVAVTVSMPWIGLLIAYEGELEIPSRSP